VSRRVTPARRRAGEAPAASTRGTPSLEAADPEQQHQTIKAALALFSAVLSPIVRDHVRVELEALRAGLAPQPEPERDERLRLKAAAKRLGRSERSVRRLIATGRLRAVRVASSGSSPVLIARSEIDRFLRELEQL
jgi:excisionase family DNA binding protein